MLKGIDHLVVVVPDLGAAARSYAALGFTVVPGGRHPVGTHNQLIAFADGSYIELIGFYQESPEHKWWEPLQRGGGLVDLCAQTDDLGADTTAFRQAGVAIDDPAPPSRKRPAGPEGRGGRSSGSSWTPPGCASRSARTPWSSSPRRAPGRRRSTDGSGSAGRRPTRRRSARPGATSARSTRGKRTVRSSRSSEAREQGGVTMRHLRIWTGLGALLSILGAGAPVARAIPCVDF